MGDVDEINYFAQAAARCFPLGRTDNDGHASQVASSNVVSNGCPVTTTLTISGGLPSDPTSSSRATVPQNTIEGVICLSSDDDEDEEQQRIHDSRGKRRVSSQATDLSIAPKRWRDYVLSEDVPLLHLSRDYDETSPSTSAQVDSNDHSNASPTPGGSKNLLASSGTAQASSQISFSEEEPSASMLRAMFANGLTPSMETLTTEDASSPEPVDESMLATDALEHGACDSSASESEEDGDSDADGDSFGYEEDNAAVVELSSDDEIELVFDSVSNRGIETTPTATPAETSLQYETEADSDAQEQDQADEPLQLIKNEERYIDDNGNAIDDDEDDRGTIVLSSDTDQSDLDDEFDDEDDDISARSPVHFTYEDPQYDFINPFLNEHFSQSGLGSAALLTEFLKDLVANNRYAELFGDRDMDAVALEIEEYAASTRRHCRSLRTSKRLQELIENEEVEPWLPGNKAKCLELFSADPSEKPNESPPIDLDEMPSSDTDADVV